MSTPIAHVNGVALVHAGEQLDSAALRQRACIELLRQAAQPNEQSSNEKLTHQAIEQLLEREVVVAQPSREEALRFYQTHPQRFTVGEQVLARHLLFAITPGVNVSALRQRAEATLLELRCHGDDPAQADQRFVHAARTLSNCPSGCQGGQLGWLTRELCVPELSSVLFGNQTVGVLPHLVRSRFGFHLLEVLGRVPGTLPQFEQVQAAATAQLRALAWAVALRHYLARLAAQANVDGVDLQVSASPLLQ
jgi:peptidyl-prolyl cis-trans isomerase C